MENKSSINSEKQVDNDESNLLTYEYLSSNIRYEITIKNAKNSINFSIVETQNQNAYQSYDMKFTFGSLIQKNDWFSRGKSLEQLFIVIKKYFEANRYSIEKKNESGLELILSVVDFDMEQIDIVLFIPKNEIKLEEIVKNINELNNQINELQQKNENLVEELNLYKSIEDKSDELENKIQNLENTVHSMQETLNGLKKEFENINNKDYNNDDNQENNVLSDDTITKKKKVIINDNNNIKLKGGKKVKKIIEENSDNESEENNEKVNSTENEITDIEIKKEEQIENFKNTITVEIPGKKDEQTENLKNSKIDEIPEKKEEEISVQKDNEIQGKDNDKNENENENDNSEIKTLSKRTPISQVYKASLSMKQIITKNVTSYCRRTHLFTIFTAITEQTMLAYGTQDNGISFYYVSENKLMHTINKAHKGPILSIKQYYDKFDNRDLLITSSKDHSFKIWDLTNKYNLLLILTSSNFSSSLLSSNILFEFDSKNKFVITADNSKCIQIFDFEGNYMKALGENSNEHPYDTVIYYRENISRDNNNYQMNYYIIEAGQFRMTSYNFINGKIYQKYEKNTNYSSLCVKVFNYRNNVTLINSEDNGKSISLWDFDKGKLIFSIFAGECLTGFCLLNEKYAVAGDMNKKLILFNLEEATVENEIKCEGSEVVSIEKISHPKYGNSIICSDYDGIMKLWSVD